jgi:CRISPR/Cas system CSM-associated protein Csm3 (group 7 of RAMP superfamily)
MAKNIDSKPKKWLETEERFVNPYIFMPVSGDVIRTVPTPGTLSGKITCTIRVVTPLAIPDHEKKRLHSKSNEHFEYPFFSKSDGTHFIPGSSVRGVVRSMYETVTNSCFSVNNNNILSARHSHQRLPGILKKTGDKWQLFTARKNKYKPDVPLNGDQVLRVWYDIERKRNVKSVFTIGSLIQCSELDKAVDDYRECLKIYRKNAEKEGGLKLDLYERSTNTLIENGMTPLFYELVSAGDQQIVYLSPAQMSRSVFHNKLNDLLGDHISCVYGDGEELCEACTLFGTLSEKGKAHASMVRFTDAKEVKFISAGYHTLKELASPKTTSVEFYTVKPDNAVAWNYDYKTVKYKKEPVMFKGKTRNMDVPVRKLEDAKIRGRKFYLHTKQNKYETSEVTKRNSTMELADTGSSFTFDVYFDSIDEKQLSRLVWTLALGENTDDSHRLYKLGHGKPLGLGSAKITVDKVLIRSYDREKFLYAVTESDVDKLISSSGIKVSKALEKLICLKTTERNKVSYPIAEDKTVSTKNSKAAHQWFIANRTVKGTGTAWNYNYVLPDITDSDITLPAYQRVFDDDTEPEKPKKYSFGEDGESFKNGIVTRKRGQNDRKPPEKDGRNKKKPKW